MKILESQEAVQEERHITEAIRKATRIAMRKHKFYGVPIVVWKDGKVVEIQPEDIVIDEEIDDEERKMVEWNV